MAWIISNKKDPTLCWNEAEKNWSSCNYDTFDDQDLADIDLPEDGVWEIVPWNKED